MTERKKPDNLPPPVRTGYDSIPCLINIITAEIA